MVRLTEAALEVRDLSLHFGGIAALQHVDLVVERGRLHALIGPNGAGKTSLLNCVSGFYRPSSGRILLHGDDVTGLRPHRMAGRGVARTFQHVDLFAGMPVIDNVLLGRHRHMRGSVVGDAVRLGRAAREEAQHRARAEEVIAFLELERHRLRVLGSLPYGIQKRVGIGVALASEPRLLLLDEPASGTTREEKEDLARFLLRIRHELGVTLVWVEHDVKLVADLADVATVLDFGTLIAEGEPRAVLAEPAVVEAYLGSPAVSAELAP